MSIFREAAVELKTLLHDDSDLRVLQASLEARLAALYSAVTLLPKRVSTATANPFPDVMQCWTNHEPRTDHSTSLSLALINATIADTLATGVKLVPEWHVVVADRLHYGEAGWSKAQAVGYKDYKVVVAGSNASGPVSFYFVATQPGPLMICDLAQDWTKLRPKNAYCRFNHCPPMLFITNTSDTVKPAYFEFESGVHYSVEASVRPF
jgi:hypothetical protein